MWRKLLIIAVAVVIGASWPWGVGLISRQTPDLRGASFDLLSDGSALEVGGDADTLIGPAGASHEVAGLSFSLSDVVPAVARVLTPATAGSGVVIDTGGSLLTNAHLVRGYSQVTVMLPDRKAVVGEVTKLDEVRDLALVALPGDRYPEASLGTEDDIVLGREVFSIGYPLNLAGAPTITKGVVSRYFHSSRARGRMIQTDAAINMGNSGGPIISNSGKVIGIVTSVAGEDPVTAPRGIGFAVSVDTIRKEFLE